MASSSEMLPDRPGQPAESDLPADGSPPADGSRLAGSGLAALRGIRVLELGSFIAGPFAGQLLADYGAEVIKIESPGSGDPMRRWGTVRAGESLWWPTISRNKKSLSLDLRATEGRDILRRLAGSADVILENFRPGRLQEWGLGYAALAELNPAIVVVHVSGFGQTGPRAAEAGFGSIGEAMGGVRYTTGSPDRPPSRTGISLGDSLAALFAVIGTAVALVERQRSGRGQEVDVAIYEAVAALMESTMADYEQAGVVRSRTGSVLPGVAPSNVYPTKDGVDVVVAANADSVFRRLCQAMGQPELADDSRFSSHGARGANADVLDAIITQWASARPADTVLETFQRHGIPAGRIFDAPAMLADEHYRARDMVLRLMSRTGVEIPMTGIVPKFSRTPGRVADVGPSLGEHTDAVLAQLAGLSADEISRLRVAGVI